MGRFGSGSVGGLTLAVLVAVGCAEEPEPAPDSPPARGGFDDDDIETVQGALLGADVDVNLGGNESNLAVNPQDTDVVAVSLCFTVSLSFDGGRTFNVADQVSLQVPPGYAKGGCDDVLTFDNQGRLFVTFLSPAPCTNPMNPVCNASGFGGLDVFVQQIDARRPGTAVASRLLDASGADCAGGAANAAQCPSNVTRAAGVNRGACDQVSGTSGRSADRQWLMADARPACPPGTPPPRATRTCSPFSNNLYVIWTDSTCGTNVPPYGMMVASSSDQGANWTGQALTAGTGPSLDVRQPGLGIGANGDMYAGYHSQGYNPDPDGTSGQIFVFQSTDGTATGLAGNMTVPFPAPSADITINRQQCVCPGSTCAATGNPCTFNANKCPGAGCECGAGDVCNPAASCANNPTAGWFPCTRRLQTNGNLTWGSQSPFIVGDPTDPNNVAVFASIENNPAGTVRDNLDIGYVTATHAATALPAWGAITRVTPNSVALPVSNQMFPMAVTGLTGSCVTLAYYDDRNPATNGQGNNVLDTFVTVNPNIWTGRTWQPEVRINDVPFDPDFSAPDFFAGEYCAGNAACVLPAGWRSGSRMGEYNGLAQAAGYSFVNDPMSGQKTLFDFSDGVAPVVTAPPPITIGSCRPKASDLGSATATDECGKPPLSAPTPTIPPQLLLGPNTITWSATDGADNTGNASQTVTVADTTGPSFTIVPADITTTSCTGVNVGSAFAEDDCGGTVTISNNAPAQFPLGTTIVTWTARDARGNPSTATQRVTALLGDNPNCCPPGTNIILGTSNNNTLTGTNNADCILGRGGQDTINGNGGNDFISGGDGDDIINGGAGNDTIYGGSGQDTVNGGDGADNLYGGDGDDHVFGGTGNDTLHGGQGQDDLRGEDGDDIIFGDTGDDTLNAGSGNNTLAGGPNNDTCVGGTGTNVFESCELGGVPNSCADGIKNGTESAIDCGGGCPGCPTGGGCAAGNDCLSGVCSGGTCQSVPGGIRVVPVVQTDWGGGYCVELQVTNASTTPTISWTATVNTNQTTIYTSWKATFLGTSGSVTVTPSLPANQVIDPAETDASVGFCANRNVPGGTQLPFVTSASGVF